jgi:hypothetical protein
MVEPLTTTSRIDGDHDLELLNPPCSMIAQFRSSAAAFFETGWNERQRAPTRRRRQAFIISQFLHGEQATPRDGTS